MNNWQPSANIDLLISRAELLQRIRHFFSEKNILEVETPLLSQATVSDCYIQSIPASYIGNGVFNTYYLQTSPEYHMKRLLAAGIGSIYQMSKAFRQGESGKLHNPEFSLLEWYRLDYDHHMLMDEMDELLQFTLGTKKAERCTYAEIFKKYLDINPHRSSVRELQDVAESQDLVVKGIAQDDKDSWLQLLSHHLIEPQLGLEQPIFIYNYPTSQAALAKIANTKEGYVAERFEVFINGIELANGFHELQDPTEQRQRFERDLQQRANLGLESVPIDENFLRALESGLPQCSGVALGIDRLVMLATNKSSIDEVMSFDFSRA